MEAMYDAGVRPDEKSERLWGHFGFFLRLDVATELLRWQWPTWAEINFLPKQIKKIVDDATADALFESTPLPLDLRESIKSYL